MILPTPVQEVATQKQDREHLKLQLFQDLEPRPESSWSLHRWMKFLELVGLLIAAALRAALYVPMIKRD